MEFIILLIALDAACILLWLACHINELITKKKFEGKFELQHINFSKWDYRFMQMAKTVSDWSKDPSTKVGAVIARNKRFISMGFNGLPSKLSDHEDRLNTRDVKLKLTVHAELNAILYANKFDVLNSTLYIFGLPPCMECSKHIISTEITKVIFCYPKEKSINNSKWFADIDMIKELYNEAGIDFLYMDYNDLNAH